MNDKSSANGSTSTSLWARQSVPQEQRVTARARQLVQGLPDWEPLPPGEILIRRPQR